MSVQAMSWAKGRAETIASQAVLFALADYADEWGITYVGQDTLALDCSCRKATVSQNLTRLEEQQLIARVRRHDKRGHRTSDHVILAPLAADRGGMRDADKRAREKHPDEVVEQARRLDTPSASSSDSRESLDARRERLDTPHERLDTRGVPEPSEEPLERTERADARLQSGVAKVDLPDGFPEQLRPHLAAVYRVLRDLAARHNAKAINPLALAQLVMVRSHKPLVEAAGEFASWADDQPAPRKDVLGGYRNWLKRCDDLAGFEQLDEQGAPHAPPRERGSGKVLALRPNAVAKADAWRDGYDDKEQAS